MFLAFGFAYTEGGPWNDDGVKAIAKYVTRIEKAFEDTLQLRTSSAAGSGPVGAAERDLRFVRHYTIRAVTTDADRFQFNTSIARTMELLSAIQRYLASAVSPDASEVLGAVDDLLRLIAPFAPHFAEELWEQAGYTDSIFNKPWPSFDPGALVRDTVEIAVQLNGVIKHRIDVETSASKESVQNQVLADPRLQALLAGRTPARFIYVPGRLANVVVK